MKRVHVKPGLLAVAVAVADAAVMVAAATAAAVVAAATAAVVVATAVVAEADVAMAAEASDAADKPALLRRISISTVWSSTLRAPFFFRAGQFGRGAFSFFGAVPAPAVSWT